MHKDEFELLTSQRFAPVLFTQFTSSLDDHILHALLLIIIVPHITNASLFAFTTAAFLIPFLLFSRHAGVLADISEKAHLIRVVKFIQFIVCIAIAFAIKIDNPWLILAAVFALGSAVAYFLPLKHSILPQLLQADELIGGNAFLNAMLFGAALIGLYGMVVWSINLQLVALVVAAAAGWISSLYVLKAPALTTDKYSYSLFEQDKIIIFCIICIAWFWAVNYIYLTQFLAYASQIIHLGYVPLWQPCALVLGVGCGSLLVNLLDRGEISLKHLPLVLLIYIVVSTDLYYSSKVHSPMHLFDLFLLGFASGMFIVPLYATLQHRSAIVFRARNIAHSSLLNVKLIILAYIVLLICKYRHITVLKTLLIVPISGVLLLLCVIYFTRKHLDLHRKY